MAPLIRIIAIVALLTATPAEASAVDRWRPFVTEASARFGIPAAWIERVIEAESGGRTTLRGRPIRSHAGAIGLMQLMPGTWADMRARLGLGSDPDDPRDNILAGSFYLRLMYERFGYPGLFAAYNAGPGRYAAYLTGKRSLPGETIAYLAAVGGASANASPPSQHLIAEPLFAVRRDAPAPAVEASAERPLSSLFAIRKAAP